MYKLVSENLTNLGGPMGTEYTFDNWVKYFHSIKNAKKHAENDYGEKIDWKKTKKRTHSPDLGYVMYQIYPIKFED